MKFVMWQNLVLIGLNPLTQFMASSASLLSLNAFWLPNMCYSLMC